jgi:caa(3)-type oxidase subunit IV
VAQHTSPQADLAHMPHDHAGASVRTYINIFVVLFVITAIEVAASWLSDIGVPEWGEIAVLVLLAVAKGILVVAFYMHLRFDSRWFQGLFLAAFGIAIFMVTAFLLLWSYKRMVGGLVV